MSETPEIVINQTATSSYSFKSMWDGFWELLRSVKLTVYLFCIITVVCIIGTLIPQNVEPQVYLQKYGAGMAYLFQIIGANDIYHTFWFTGLLVLLAVSTSVCATYRYRVARRFLREPAIIMDESFYSSGERGMKTYSSLNVNDAAELAKKELHKNHFVVGQKEKEDAVFIFAQNGRLNQWGNLLIHVCVIVIMVGTIFGNTRLSVYLSRFFVSGPLKSITSSVDGQYAFSEHMQINEGETLLVPHMDFQLRLNKFEVEFQKDGKMPKDFRSFVTVIKDGKEVSNNTIRVNHTLKYEGVTFYQSSYGQSPNPNRITIRVLDPVTKAEITKIGTNVGDTVQIPGTTESFKVAQFIPDFALGPDMQPFSKSNELKNPAVKIEEYANGVQGGKTWLFPQMGDFHGGKNTQYLYEVADLTAGMMSVFQVVKDPGVPIIYLGFIGLILGTICSLLREHKRVWMKITPNEKGSLVRLTTHANRRTNHRVPEAEAIIPFIREQGKA